MHHMDADSKVYARLIIFVCLFKILVQSNINFKFLARTCGSISGLS